MRVGSEETTNVEVRLLAATNRAPEEAVRQGQLRKDLFYRLKVFQVSLVPLRQRPEDIEPLVRHFLDELASREGQTKSLSEAAMGLLQRYSWPGNFRELKNALHSAYVLADKQINRSKPIHADFVGVSVPDRYVFGFGMDVEGAWRNLPAIYAVKE